MKEIIDQISRIDAVAYENEQKNKAILINEKQKYESEIKKYRDQKLEIANDNAKIIYHQIINKAKSDLESEKEKNSAAVRLIEDNFRKVETDVIDNVFTSLFSLD